MQIIKVLFITFSISILSLNCSNYAVKGDSFRDRWMFENHYNVKIPQKPIRADESKLYNMKAAVLISEKTMEGDEWEQSRRRQKPNLKLYLLKGDHEQILICDKKQAISLSCEYPLKMSGEDILNFRLINDHNDYARYEYSSKYENDKEINVKDEKPLAQTDIIFEGQGKYYKDSGAGTFIITFVEIKN